MGYNGNIKSLGITEPFNGNPNFLGSVGTGNLFLNLYPGAAVAYSVFKLSLTYMGPCLRVRRSSDNAEQNIGFVDNYIDTASLLSFIGVNSAFVVTLYDQSGNGNDLIQETASFQPLIVVAGSLTTINSKAAIYLDGLNDFFSLTVPINNNNLYSSLSVIKRFVIGDMGIALQNVNTAGGGCYTPFVFTDNKIYLRSDSGFDATNSADPTTNQQQLSGTVNSSTKIIYKNNIILPSTNTVVATSSQFNGLGKFNNTMFARGYVQEIIFYSSDQSASLSAMNINRISAFGII